MAEIKKVFSFSEALELRSLINPRVGTLLLEFLILLFLRLEKNFGLKIFFVPKHMSPDLKIKPFYFQNLQQLVSQKVIKDFTISQHHFSDEPRFFRVMISPYSINSAKNKIYGCSLTNWDIAWNQAIEETIKYWLGKNFDTSIEQRKNLSWQQIESFAHVKLVSEDTDFFSRKGAIYYFDKRSTFECVGVEHLGENKKVWLPLQFFSNKHAARVIDRRYEPPLSSIGLENIGVGSSREEAEFKAMNQLIQHSVGRSYLEKGQIPDRVDLENVGSTVALLIANSLNKYNLQGYFFLLKNPFNLLILQALIIDPSGVGPRLSGGLSLGNSLDECLESAFLEAVQKRLDTRGSLDNPDSIDISSNNLIPLDSLNQQLSRKALSFDEMKKRESLSLEVSHQNLLNVLNQKGYSVFSRPIWSTGNKYSIDLVAVSICVLKKL